MASGNIASVPHVVTGSGWVVGDGTTKVRGRVVGGSAFGGTCTLYDDDPTTSPPLGNEIAKAMGGAGQADFALQSRYVPFTVGLYAVLTAGTALVYTEGS